MYWVSNSLNYFYNLDFKCLSQIVTTYKTNMQQPSIQSKICEVRGQKIMLDFDLAEMYETETKYLKRAVKNNLKRFPPDFIFTLTKAEWKTLRCSFRTSNSIQVKKVMQLFPTIQGY